MNCPNCQTPLSCGCQKRKASNGNEVCSNCLAFYEASLSNEETRLQTKTNVLNNTNTTPTNVTVTYKPPINLDSL